MAPSLQKYSSIKHWRSSPGLENSTYLPSIFWASYPSFFKGGDCCDGSPVQKRGQGNRSQRGNGEYQNTHFDLKSLKETIGDELRFKDSWGLATAGESHQQGEQVQGGGGARDQGGQLENILHLVASLEIFSIFFKSHPLFIARGQGGQLGHLLHLLHFRHTHLILRRTRPKSFYVAPATA